MGNTLPVEDWGVYVDWLVAYLHRHGVTDAEMSDVIGRAIGDASGCFLPIDEYLTLFGWGVHRLSAPHLGLDIADQLQANDIGIYGYLLDNSPTVGDFFESVERYQLLFMRGMGFRVRAEHNQFEVQYQIFRPPGEGVRQDVELTVAAFVCFLRAVLGDAICPRRAVFSHACREPAERYEKTFNCDVSFGREQNYLVFNSDLLRLPLSDGDPTLLAILKEHANGLLQEWEAKQSLVEQIKFLIATSLESEVCGIEMLANRLNTTRRTLNRRLQREGTNYQRLREEVIVELAKRSLARSHESITVIAGKLGYSESSAFVRAFKRLTGTTPVAYRANAQ